MDKKKQNKSHKDKQSSEGEGSPSNIIRMVSICWLLLLAGFLAGVFVYGTQVWPYPIIRNVTDFVKGHEEEQTSLAEKIRNDLDIEPTRHMADSGDDLANGQGKADKALDSETDNREVVHSMETPFVENRLATSLEGLPIKDRRKNPKMYLSKKAPKGYRAIYGPFDFKGSRHGVILIDPEGKVANVWQTSQEDVSWMRDKDTNVYPHGFEIAPDGSIVTAFDGGTSLIKYDYCGNMVWSVMGGFHHSIDFDGSGSLWTWGDRGKNGKPTPYGRFFMKMDYATGELLKIFHINNVMNANVDIDIFGILQDDSGSESKWIKDEESFYWHVNDIEALPERLAKYYPGFSAGDLLVSFRAPDLVFVMDPYSLKVKWWRQGLTRRQHDPDWNDKGTITIFNNNMNRGYSSIVELDPVTNKHKTVVDGRKYKFYSSIRGKHQALPNGGYLITSSTQGRVFEVDAGGNLTFDFLNVYDDNKKYLSISEARFLPPDFFKELPKCD